MEVTFRKDCCLQLQFSVAWGIARLRQIVKQYHETMVNLSWPCKRYPLCNELCMGTLWVPEWKILNQSQNDAHAKPVCHMLDKQGEAQLISQLASAFSSATLAIYLSSPWVSSLQNALTILASFTLDFEDDQCIYGLPSIPKLQPHQHCCHETAKTCQMTKRSNLGRKSYRGIILP